MPHTVGDVPSHKLETVDAQKSLISTIEIMFEKEYSQLGIKRDGEIVGMISYRSISRVLSLLKKLEAEKNLPGRKAGIAIEDISPRIGPDEELIMLFDLLSENPYVIIDEDQEQSLKILTDYDLLQYLRDSIEPFLLIEDIERSIREIIQHGFDNRLNKELDEFFSERDVRTPSGITDCSFGHYAQFMPPNWNHFEDYFEENGDFVRRLILEVGDFRNKIFHFRSESYDSHLEEEIVKFAHGYFKRRLPNR